MVKKYLVFKAEDEPIQIDTKTWAEEVFGEIMRDEDLTEDEIVIWEVEGTIKKHKLEVKHTWKEQKE